MQVTETMIHEFHFVLDKSLGDVLHGLRQDADNQSLAKFITGVLELLFPWLEHEHLFGKERQTRYGFVNDDLLVPRLHMHLILPYSLYKRMKLVYQDLNFYSIAQLVRWLLGEFIDLTKLKASFQPRNPQEQSWKSTSYIGFITQYTALRGILKRLIILSVNSTACLRQRRSSLPAAVNSLVVTYLGPAPAVTMAFTLLTGSIL